MTKSETTPQTALQRRKQRSENRGNSAPADWESCNPKDILKLIATVTALSGTVTFGYTRDGGAYYLSYYVDGEALKVYIRPTEDVDAFILHEVNSWLEE
jgi:hypothetical protein